MRSLACSGGVQILNYRVRALIEAASTVPVRQFFRSHHVTKNKQPELVHPVDYALLTTRSCQPAQLGQEKTPAVLREAGLAPCLRQVAFGKLTAIVRNCGALWAYPAHISGL